VKHWQPHCTVGGGRQTVQSAAAAVGMINAVMVAALAGGLLMLDR
jgi:hypothetical protein